MKDVVDIQRAIGGCDGYTAALWTYSASLEELRIRLLDPSSDRGVEIVCNACSAICGPTSWLDARMTVVSGGDDGQVLVIDERAGFRTVCRLVRIFEIGEPRGAAAPERSHQHLIGAGASTTIVDGQRFPSSEIASPIFAGVWGLTFLGAVRAHQPPPFPLGPVWREHAKGHLGEICELRDGLIREMSFSPQVAEMLLDDWRAGEAAESNVGDDDIGAVDAQIAAYLGILGQPRAWSDAERGEVVEQAIRHQLVCLFDALVVAAYGAMLEGRVVATSAAEHLLWIAGGVVGKEALYGARDAREFLDILLRWWRESAHEIRRGSSPEVDAWVEGYVGDLEKQAGTRGGT